MAADVNQLAKKKLHNLTDDEWQARGDAQALATAELIKSDQDRYEAAKLWAQVLSIQEREETEAMQKVANA